MDTNNEKVKLGDTVKTPTGAVGKVIEFDDQGFYTVCVGITVEDGEYARRWFTPEELTKITK